MTITDIYNYAGVTLKVEGGTRRVYYEYWIDEDNDFGFKFSLLSEVGAPWQPAFRELIAYYELNIELYDNGNDYYERIAQRIPGRM